MTITKRNQRVGLPMLKRKEGKKKREQGRGSNENSKKERRLKLPWSLDLIMDSATSPVTMIKRCKEKVMLTTGRRTALQTLKMLHKKKPPIMMRTFSSTLTQEHLKKNKKRRMKMPRSIWMICSLVQATRIHPIRIKRSICSPSTTSSRRRKKKKRTTLIHSLSVSQTLSHLPMLMQSQMSQLSRQNSFQTLCLTRSSNNSR